MVLEEDVDGKPLVGRTRDVAWLHILTILVDIIVVEQIFGGFHQREGDPRFDTTDELATQFHIDTGGIAFRIVLCGIYNLHIVNTIGDEIGEIFVVGLSCKLKRTVPHPEGVVGREGHLVRVLRLDAAVEGAVLVAHLAVEGRLIVAAGFQAEHPLVFPSGREREDEAWRHGKLLVEGPVVRPQPAVKYPLLVFVNCPGGLNEPIDSDGVKGVVGGEKRAKVQDARRVVPRHLHSRHGGRAGYGVSARVKHFPLFDMVVDDFVLYLHAPFDLVAGEGVLSAQVGGGHHGGEAVAGVLEERAIAAHVGHLCDVIALAA